MTGPNSKCRPSGGGVAGAIVRRCWIQANEGFETSSQVTSVNPLSAISRRTSAGDYRKLIDGILAHGTGKWMGCTAPAMIS